MRYNYIVVKGIRQPKILFKTQDHDEAIGWIGLYRNSKKSKGVNEVYVYKYKEKHYL